MGTDRLRRLGICGMRRGDAYNPRQTLELAKHDLAWLERPGCFFLPLWSSDYPWMLRQIYDPPFGLYARASTSCTNFFLDMPQLAVIGTRKPSPEGMAQAYAVSRQLSMKGIGIVSGLARGIDSAAHKGSLAASGRTIAVLGHGCDTVYPRIHAALASKIILNGGLLLSEYPPGTTPLPFRFPQRNRIISGLSSGVLVVEAPEKSGALITVDFALEQGRDVVVMASLMHSRRNTGGHALHEMGAPASNTADEIAAYIFSR